MEKTKITISKHKYCSILRISFVLLYISTFTTVYLWISTIITNIPRSQAIKITNSTEIYIGQKQISLFDFHNMNISYEDDITNNNNIVIRNKRDVYDCTNSPREIPEELEQLLFNQLPKKLTIMMVFLKVFLLISLINIGI